MELIKTSANIYNLFNISIYLFLLLINLEVFKFQLFNCLKGLFIEYDVDVASVYSIRFQELSSPC